MTPPTIPPEAVEAAARASYEYRNEESWNGPNDETRLRYRDDAGVIISAAYPALRRAILEQELPRIVEMARAMEGWQGDMSHKHTPASILAALEKGE